MSTIINIVNVEKVLRSWNLPVTSKMARLTGKPQVVVTGDTIQCELDRLHEEMRPTREAGYEWAGTVDVYHIAVALAEKSGYERTRPINGIWLVAE